MPAGFELDATAPRRSSSYKRRFLRIVPAYWASLVILTLAGPKTGSSFLDTLVHAVFLQNFSQKTGAGCPRLEAWGGMRPLTTGRGNLHQYAALAILMKI